MGITVIPQPSSSQSKKTQTITSSSTWTVPTGVNSVDVTCVGGGASIGGAGAVIKGTIDTSSIQGTGISVTIGASTAPGSFGSAGSTSFGSYMTAGGGFSAVGNYCAGMSGTRFVSGVLIPASSTLIPFVSDFSSSSSISASNIVYNSTAGLWMTAGAFSGTTFYYYTSSNGTAWTLRTTSVSTTINTFSGLFSANNRFFILFKDGSSYSYYITSTDGINWSTIRAIPINSVNFNAGNAGVIYSSTSGKYYFGSWWPGNYAALISGVTAANVATNDPTSETILSDANSGSITTKLLTNGSNLGVCFAINFQFSNIQSSVFNGTTWAAFSSVATFNTSNYPISGVWDGSKFTVVTQTGAIYTSTNASTWTSTGTTIPGLFISGWTGTYYYGHISNVLAYSTNGTTWTTVASRGAGSNSSPNQIANNSNLLITNANVNSHGMLESFNITSPNTTIATGYTGQAGNPGSGYVYAHGGAGGPGYFETTYGSFFSTINRQIGEGVDGYGLAINSSAGVVGSPPTYGSTNGSFALQGAVILSWMQ